MKRYDLVTVSACYTTDHEMEPSDDGEWVRFEEVAEALTACQQERDEAQSRRMRLRETLQAVYFDRFLRGYNEEVAQRSAEKAIQQIDGDEPPPALTDLRSRLQQAEAALTACRNT